jgi:anti-sigma regulatory factor (Ser/Thr protein kinase)
MLDQAFDSDSLYALRAAVAANASQAGLPQPRVGDLVIAAHELAANAIRHGAGRGRLRLWPAGQSLYCEVTDDGPAQAMGTGKQGDYPESRDAGPWPIQHGRGLWVIHQVADEVSLHSGRGGTVATIAFSLRPAR